MAYYISKDGTVHGFETEVKEDGSLRPRNYHDFTDVAEVNTSSLKLYNNPNNYPPVPASKKDCKQKSGNQATTPKRDDRKLEYAPMAALRNAIREARKKPKISMFSLPDQEIISFWKKYPIEKEICLQKINNLLLESGLDESVKALVLPYLQQLKWIEIGWLCNKAGLSNPQYDFCRKAVKKIVKAYNKNLLEVLNIITQREEAMVSYRVPTPSFDFPVSVDENQVCLNVKKTLGNCIDKSGFSNKAKDYVIKVVSTRRDVDTKMIEQDIVTRGLKNERLQILSFFNFYNRFLESHSLSFNPQKKCVLAVTPSAKLDRTALEKLGNSPKRQFMEELYDYLDANPMSKDAFEYFIKRAWRMTQIVVHREGILEDIEEFGLKKDQQKILHAILFYNDKLENSDLPSRSGRFRRANNQKTKDYYTSPRPTTSVQNYVKHGPLPAYGYARDYFGRVQERDRYREDKPVNPYNSTSTFDEEDDHENHDIMD